MTTLKELRDAIEAGHTVEHTDSSMGYIGGRKDGTRYITYCDFDQMVHETLEDMLDELDPEWRDAEHCSQSFAVDVPHLSIAEVMTRFAQAMAALYGGQATR